MFVANECCFKSLDLYFRTVISNCSLQFCSDLNFIVFSVCVCVWFALIVPLRFRNARFAVKPWIQFSFASLLFSFLGELFSFLWSVCGCYWYFCLGLGLSTDTLFGSAMIWFQKAQGVPNTWVNVSSNFKDGLGCSWLLCFFFLSAVPLGPKQRE